MVDIEKYTGKTVKSDKALYKPYGKDKSKDRQVNIDIRDKSGNGSIIPYAHILRIEYISHQFITLFCSNCIITIEGKNLKEIVEMLHDAKIRYLQEFNAKDFPKPENKGPIINKMVLENIGISKD